MHPKGFGSRGSIGAEGEDIEKYAVPGMPAPSRPSYRRSRNAQRNQLALVAGLLEPLNSINVLVRGSCAVSVPSTRHSSPP